MVYVSNSTVLLLKSLIKVHTCSGNVLAAAYNRPLFKCHFHTSCPRLASVLGQEIDDK